MNTDSIVDQGDVAVSIHDGIASIEFHHPKSNSLPGKVLRKLAESIIEAGANSEAKVVVLRSKGEKAFCAGASFDELISIEDYETGKEFFMGFARVINAVRTCPKFVLARVQGKAVGGGVGMAAASDYCFATNAAAVKLSELAIGIGPFVVGPAVERKVGKSAFSALTINATEWQDANWAREKGLFNELHGTTEAMDEAIERLAGKLAASNPEAMSMLKTAMWKENSNWDELLEQRAEMSGKLVLSDFTVNAIQQFKQGTR